MDVTLLIIGIVFVSFFAIVFVGAPYVPTLKRGVDDLESLYMFTKKDVLLDLGSGDGIVLRNLSPRVKRAVGYELSPWVYLISRIVCRSYKNIDIKYANIWNKPLPDDVTVVYAFFHKKYMQRIADKIQTHVDETGKRVSVISLGFTFPGRKSIDQKGAMYLYQFTPLYKHK